MLGGLETGLVALQVSVSSGGKLLGLDVMLVGRRPGRSSTFAQAQALGWRLKLLRVAHRRRHYSI